LFINPYLAKKETSMRTSIGFVICLVSLLSSLPVQAEPNIEVKYRPVKLQFPAPGDRTLTVSMKVPAIVDVKSEKSDEEEFEQVVIRVVYNEKYQETVRFKLERGATLEQRHAEFEQDSARNAARQTGCTSMLYLKGLPESVADYTKVGSNVGSMTKCRGGGMAFTRYWSTGLAPDLLLVSYYEATFITDFFTPIASIQGTVEILSSTKIKISSP
jgi:hypothetical protein